MTRAFNSASGLGTTGAINSIRSADALFYRPDVLNELIEVFDDMAIVDEMVMQDQDLPSVSRTVDHYETGSLMAKAIVGTITSATASSVTFEIDAASVVNSGGVFSSPIIARKTVLVAGGRAEAYVTVVSKPSTTAAGHTITIVRVDGATFDLGALIVVGDAVAPKSNAEAAGSDLPDGVIRIDARYQSQFQIIKTATKTVDGSTDTETHRVSWNGTDHEVDREMAEMVRIHKIELALQFYLGTGGTYTNAAGKKVPTFEGLYSVAYNFGLRNNIPRGQLDVSDLYDLANNALYNQLGRELLVEMGVALGQDSELMFAEMFKGNPSFGYFNKMGGDGKQRAIDLGYDSVKANNVTLHRRNQAAFSWLNVTYIPGMPSQSVFDYTAVVTPAKTNQITTDGGGGTPRKISAVSKRLRYISGSGKNKNRRLRPISVTPDNNGGFDTWKEGIMSDQCAQFTGMSQYAVINPLD